MSLRYGDIKYKERDPERDLDPDEIMLLFANYQRFHDLRRAGKAVNTTPERALDYITKQIEENPKVLEDPRLLLIMGMTLEQISIDCLNQSAKKVETLFGRHAAQTGVYTGKMSEMYKKAYLEKVGGKMATMDAEKVDEQLEEAQDELDAIRGSGGSPETPASDSDTPKSGTGAGEGVDGDADSGDAQPDAGAELREP